MKKRRKRGSKNGKEKERGREEQQQLQQFLREQRIDFDALGERERKSKALFKRLRKKEREKKH